MAGGAVVGSRLERYIYQGAGGDACGVVVRNRVGA